MNQLLTQLEQWLLNLWNKNKLLFLLLVPLFLIVQFRNLLMDFLVAGARQLYQKAQQQDKVLSQQEDQANNQADQLVQEAKDKADDTTKVDDDWYKSK